jgi:hypothetical protein
MCFSSVPVLCVLAVRMQLCSVLFNLLFAFVDLIQWPMLWYVWDCVCVYSTELYPRINNSHNRESKLGQFT